MLATGMAGCVGTGPFPQTSVEVTLRETFETDPPPTVPLEVSVFLQNVDSTAMAMRNVSLELYDPAAYDGVGERIDHQELGTFTYRDAPEDRRETETYDVWGGEVTAYRVEHVVETTVETESVPQWITFGLGAVDLSDEDASAMDLGAGPVQTQPPPLLSVGLLEYDFARPVPDTVGPADYRRRDRKFHAAPDGPVLPLLEDQPGTTEPGTNGTGGNETGPTGGDEATANGAGGDGTRNGTGDGTRTETTRDETG